MRIQDARGLPLSIDRGGFQLVQHTSSVTDFYDDVQIEGIYNAEIERLVAATTGASRAVVFDHTRRAESKETREEKGIREPAQCSQRPHGPVGRTTPAR